MPGYFGFKPDLFDVLSKRVPPFEALPVRETENKTQPPSYVLPDSRVGIWRQHTQTGTVAPRPSPSNPFWGWLNKKKHFSL
jgi:hypothetical protein